MLPNRLLVGAAWDWAGVAVVKLPKRLEVGFDCPNNEDMVKEYVVSGIRYQITDITLVRGSQWRREVYFLKRVKQGLNPVLVSTSDFKDVTNYVNNQ